MPRARMGVRGSAPHQDCVLEGTMTLSAGSANPVDHHNHDRYHESRDNLTPADVYFGRATGIIAERARIKRQTIRGPMGRSNE